MLGDPPCIFYSLSPPCRRNTCRTVVKVMLTDGLKVIKHQRSSKEARSRVIRFVPDYGGALVWGKPDQSPKNSCVPLDAITQVELEVRL